MVAAYTANGDLFAAIKPSPCSNTQILDREEDLLLRASSFIPEKS